MQYFGNNLTVSDVFSGVVKTKNHTEPLSAELVWYTLKRNLPDLFMACHTTSESTVLGLPDFTWLSSFLQPERNFYHLVTELWSTASLPFLQQMFLFASMALWPSLNSLSISSLIRLRCTFICTTFKLRTELSKE